MVCAPVRSIIPSLKLGDNLSVQAHKPCSISHIYSDPQLQITKVTWKHMYSYVLYYKISVLSSHYLASSSYYLELRIDNLVNKWAT